jgi:hypothetical protein
VSSLTNILHDLVDHSVNLFDKRQELHEQIDQLGNTVKGADETPPPPPPPAPTPLTPEEEAAYEALLTRRAATASPAPAPEAAPEEETSDASV